MQLAHREFYPTITLSSLSNSPSHSVKRFKTIKYINLFQRTPLTVSEKNIIVNVYKYLEQSSPQNKRNKTTLHTKTADIVGIGVAAVYRILREHARNNIKAPLETKKRPLFSEKISESQKSAIRKKVYSFYENDQLPTGKKALKAVSEDDTLPTFRRTTFHKIMKHLQFKYVRTKARNAVLDKDEMVLWRRNYLDKVMEYRKGNRPIFYVDEGWINLGMFTGSITYSLCSSTGHFQNSSIYVKILKSSVYLISYFP